MIANTQLPVNWSSFLRGDESKTELYGFISDKVMQEVYVEGKEICCTQNQNVISPLHKPEDPFV